MLKTYEDILSETDIECILNLSEVKKAKEAIDKKVEGSIYFSNECRFKENGRCSHYYEIKYIEEELEITIML